MIFFDLSFANVYQQYLLCRKNKRNTVNALRFEVVQEQELLRLTDELQNRTYTPSRSVCFFASRPKLREIFAADFRDRIVHHILVDYLEQIFEPIFIEQSFACRKGKGVHAGVKTLQKYCRKVSCNGSKPAYFMQLDIANYFMSIDKTILFSLLNKHVNDANALWLTKLLVFHDCTENFTLKGNLELLKAIPAHKTLINTPDGKGLPIGNLNSKLIRKYKIPKQFVNVKQQYNYFRWRFNELEGKKIIVLFQVGKFIEFYHQQDKFIATLLGLKPISENKRGALFGFPLTKLPVVMRALLVKGYACCFVKQSDIIFNKVMQRKPSWIRYYI